jgi:hypothetical protein
LFPQLPLVGQLAFLVWGLMAEEGGAPHTTVLMHLDLVLLFQ